MTNGFTDDYLQRLAAVLKALDRTKLDFGIELIRNCWENGRQIITLGNGGSAMTAQHFVTDWGKMFRLSRGRALNARSLLDNLGLITAYANDVSFEDVFAEQLKDILSAGDLVIAISGSGNSENIIRAVEYANTCGAITLGLCGFSGGRLRDTAQHSIWVNCNDMQLCEDVHAIFGHIVMQAICQNKY